MKRTAQMIEENTEKTSATKPKRKMHPNSLKNLVAPWQPGQAVEGAGRKKKDIAAEIAAKAFENNAEHIYKACSEALLKGNPYAFSVYADRAFGKLKEKVEHTVNEDLIARLQAGRKRVSEK